MHRLSANPEIWKDIPGFEGQYQASTFGRIRSVDHFVRVVPHGVESTRLVKGRVLRPGKQYKSGHLSVVLGRAYGSIPVHTAVALTFIGPRPDGMDVCHNDGNPENNHVENLRYDTRTDNILDVYRTGKRWRKLSLKDIKEIDWLLKTGMTGHEIAQSFGVSDTLVSAIKNRRYKSCQLL